MSTEIDQRVVEMKFDNRNFEKNVSTSMSTLKKFEKSLRFKGATKGIEQINKTASKFELSPMEKAVDAVEVKFSKLEIITHAALTKIVDAAMNAGTKLVKSLSVDNITAGWAKYDEKTASVQTIMNATGKSIDEVNRYLDKLMWFSDETSYSFTDMTKAIATMTSSGGDIEKLIPMVMGVANATAYAGKGAAEFTRVMYNLNQAYSAGSIKLIDWKSIQNAGVDSKQLKQELIDAAVALGVIKEGEVTLANFTESLKDNWASTAVMEKAFGKFAEMSEMAFGMVQRGEVETATEAYKILAEQYNGIGITAAKAAQEAKTFTEAIDATKDAVASGWMKTFELIFGNYQEAKALWTDLAEGLYTVFAEGGNDRNDVLSEALDSGYQMLVKKYIPSADVFKEKIFEIARAEALLTDEEIEEHQRNFNESLKEGWLTADLLQKALYEYSGDLRGYDKETLAAMGYTKDQIDMLDRLSNDLLRGKVIYEDYSELMSKDSGRENFVASLHNLWDALFLVDEETGKAIGIISILKEVLAEIFPPLAAENIYEFTVKLREFTSKLILSEEKAEGLKNILTLLLTPLKWLASLLRQVFGFLGSVISYVGKLSGKFLEFFQDVDSVGGALSKLFGGKNADQAKKYSNIITRIKTAFSKLKQAVADAFNTIKNNEKVQAVISKVRNALGSAFEWILEKVADLAEWASKIDFVGIFEKVIAFGSKVVTFFQNAWATIKGFFAEFKSLSFSEGITLLWEKLKGLFRFLTIKPDNWLGGFIAEIKQSLADAMPFIEKAKTAIADFFKSLTPGKIIVFAFSIALIAVIANISNLAKSLTGLVGTFSGMLKDIKSKFIKTTTISNVAAAITALTAALVTLSTVNPEGLQRATISLAVMAGVLMIMFGVVDAIASSKKITPDTAKNIQNVSIALLAVAGAMLALSLSLFVLSKIDMDGILLKIGSLFLVLGAAILACKAIAKIAQGEEFRKAAVGFVFISASLLLFVAALKSLAKIDPSKLATATASLLVVFTDMMLIALASRVASFKGAAGLLVMALSLTTFVKILEKLANTDPAKLISIMPQFLVLVAMLGALGIVARTAGEDAALGGIGILAVVGGIYVLVTAIAQLSAMDWKQLLKGGVVVGALIVLFGVFAKLSTAIAKDKETISDAAKLALPILAISIAIRILVKAIEQLGTLPVGDLLKGGIAVVAMLGMIAVIAKAASNTGKAALALFAMIFVLGILAASIAFLTMLPADELLAASGALALVMLGWAAALTVAQKALEKVNLGKMAIIILEMAAILAAFAAAFNYLPRDMSWEQIAAYSAGLSTTILAFAGAIALLGTVKDPKNALKSVGVMLALISLVGLIAAAVGTFADAETMQAGIDILSKLEALGVVLGGATVLVAALSGIAKLKVGLVDFAKVAVNLGIVIMGIAGIAYLAGQIDGSSIAAGVKNLLLLEDLWTVLGGALLATAAISAIAKFIGAPMKAVLPVLGIIALVIAGFAALALALGELLTVVSESVITSGIDLLVKIGEGIGRFVGAVVGGLVAQMADYLPEIANSIVGFVNAFASTDTTATDNLNNVADAILSFAEAGILNIFNGKNNLKKVGEQLSEFAPYFGAFLEEFGKYEIPDNIDQITGVMKGVGELMSAMPRNGGLVGSILGDKQALDSFGEGIGKFGEGLKQFFESLSGVTINQEEVDSAVNAGKALAGLQEAIPASGGKLQQFLGEHNWTKFSAEMVLFGSAIVAFCSTVKGIETGDAEKAAAAGTALAKLQAAIPASGGKLQEWLGEHNWAQFNSEMVLFGRAIVAFCEEIRGKISLTNVTEAAAAGMLLAKLNDNIPASGGSLQAWIGEKDMGKFGDNLTALGRGMSNFATYLTVVKWDTFEQAIGAVDALVQIASMLGDENGFLQLWTGQSQGLDGFGQDLATLGEKLKEYYETIKDLDYVKLNEAADVLRRLAMMSEVMSRVETDGISNFQTALIILANGGLSEFTDYFKTAEVQAWLEESGNDIIYAVCRGINNIAGDQMGAAAIGAVNGFNTRFLSYTDERVSSIASQFAFKYWTAIHEEEDQFHAIGAFAVEGIIGGIGDEWPLLMDYVRAKVAEMVNAFQIELSIASPSKVMRDEVGRYIVMGIAEGIDANTSAEEAAAQKAKNIVDAFKKEISKVDLKEETQGLEYKLWSSINSAASDETKYLKQIERQNEKLKNQAEKVMLAEAEYRATILAVGEDAEETQTAYNKYLKEQITMREYAQELLELQASQLETAVKHEELGKYVVENIAYGITSNMSAEDAASQKANNIVSAFKKVLDKFDMDIETSDLEYQVWEAANSSANSTEKMLKKIELLDKKLQSQAEKTMAAEAEYKATLSSFGADSDYTKEAYQKYLQKQLDMLELANEMAEYQDKPVYYRAMQLMESRAALGEELANDSASFFAENQDSSTMKIIKDYMKDVDVVIAGIDDVSAETLAAVTENANTIERILDEFVKAVDVMFGEEGKKAGSNYAAGIAQGITQGMADGLESERDAARRGLDAILMKAQTAISSGNFFEGFTGVQEGFQFIAGLREGLLDSSSLSVLRGAVGTVARTLPEYLQELLGIASPSKVAMEIGEYFVIGLAQGFINMLHLVIQNATKVGDEAVDAVTGIMAKMDQILTGDLDFEPVISPVLDLSGVYADASRLGSMLDATGSYAMAANAYQQDDASRIAHEDARTQLLVDNLGRRIDALQYSLDDLRAVVEARGHGDLYVDVDVDGAQFARVTVPDYINASRAAGTPFYNPPTK